MSPSIITHTAIIAEFIGLFHWLTIDNNNSFLVYRPLFILYIYGCIENNRRLGLSLSQSFDASARIYTCNFIWHAESFPPCLSRVDDNFSSHADRNYFSFIFDIIYFHHAFQNAQPIMAIILSRMILPLLLSIFSASKITPQAISPSLL